MLNSFYNEAQVQAGETSLRLVLNMRTIDAVESLTAMTMPHVMERLLGPNPPMTLAGKVLWGLLREHNPDVTLDQALDLSVGEHSELVGLALGDLFRRAFHIGEAKEANPPKRRGRSKVTS